MQRTQALVGAKADVQEALQGVYQVRALSGMPPKPENPDDLASVPPDLDQTFSTVREAQARLVQAAAKIGVYESFNITPKQMVKNFYDATPAATSTASTPSCSKMHRVSARRKPSLPRRSATSIKPG